MTQGGNTKQQAVINVTPLIDVLLVLLIIFMVITPSMPTGLPAVVPQQADRQQQPQSTVVISVLGNGTVRINQEPVELGGLGKRLSDLFMHAANRVVFVRGGRDLEFRHVAEVIDIAKGAGLDRIGLMTE